VATSESASPVGGAQPPHGEGSRGLSLYNKSAETILVFNRDRRLALMKQSVLTSSRLLEGQFSERGYQVVMVTLTYAPAVDWEPYHIVQYTNRLYKWACQQKVDLGYTWVMELTKSKRPHYHVLVWLPKVLFLPSADRAGWWRHGMTRTERAQHAVGYMAKYASKGFDEGEIPRGARIHGAGGLGKDQRSERRWWKLPRYVREQFPQGEDIVPIAGGGWTSRSSGTIVRSEWVLVAVGPGWVRLGRRSELSPQRPAESG